MYGSVRLVTRGDGSVSLNPWDSLRVAFEADNDEHGYAQIICTKEEAIAFCKAILKELGE